MPFSRARTAARAPVRTQAAFNSSAFILNPAVPYAYFTPSGAGDAAKAAEIASWLAAMLQLAAEFSKVPG